jgi:hypothetical protein
MTEDPNAIFDEFLAAHSSRDLLRGYRVRTRQVDVRRSRVDIHHQYNHLGMMFLSGLVVHGTIGVGIALLFGWPWMFGMFASWGVAQVVGMHHPEALYRRSYSIRLTPDFVEFCHTNFLKMRRRRSSALQNVQAVKVERRVPTVCLVLLLNDGTRIDLFKGPRDDCEIYAAWLRAHLERIPPPQLSA